MAGAALTKNKNDASYDRSLFHCFEFVIGGKRKLQKKIVKTAIIF